MATTTRVRRERPKVIRLSEAAAARIHDIMNKSEGRYIGVRVGVKNGGCAGMSYTMDYAESQGPLDEIVEDKGVRILVDPKAVMFLVGTEMDFKRDKLSQRFIFVNPNQTEACGCGESVVILPAKDETEN
jgi:iron-sulfur cluster assembly protein